MAAVDRYTLLVTCTAPERAWATRVGTVAAAVQAEPLRGCSGFERPSVTRKRLRAEIALARLTGHLRPGKGEALARISPVNGMTMPPRSSGCHREVAEALRSSSRSGAEGGAFNTSQGP